MPTKRLLTAEDLYNFKFVEDPQLSPDGSRLAFVRMDVNKTDNKYERHIWLIALDEKDPQPRQFTFGAKSDWNPRWSPDGQTLAFVSARNDKPQIFMIDVNGGEARPLTSLPNGASNPTWSPDGARMVFLSDVNAEERAREDADEKDAPPASALEAKHRKEKREQAEKDKIDPRLITRLPYRTGTEYYDDRRSHIYVMAVKDGTPRRLTDGELDFQSIAWSADGAFIFSTQSLDPEHEPWEHQAIVRISATGARKPYRILSQPGYDYSGVQASPNGKWLAATFINEEGSWGQRRRLALMPVVGGPAVVLTEDFDRAVESFAWAADSRALYFTAGDRGDVGVYRVSVRGGAATPVIGGTRTVLGFSVDKAGDVAFIAHTPNGPADVSLLQAGAEKQLTRFNDELLAARHVAPIEEVWHTASDGRKIQGWLLKPIGFKRGQKYPLVVSMHGGPWVMWGPSMPNIWLEWQQQAARGYAVYFCNPRGSEGYGEEFSMLIRNDWGNHVMYDILAGLDNVLSRGWVDDKRMALTGGSYAGYMTAWMVGHYHGFACAWAQRGLYNLASFYGTTDVPQLIEREFETNAFDDPEKLWKQSPLAYVRDIRTPLAIEHQDQDYRCPVSEAEQLFAALRRLRRDVLFIRYPREGHEMSRAGEPKHRVDRLNRMADWFDKYCGEKPKAKSVKRRA